MASIVNLDKVASIHVDSVQHTAVLENGNVLFVGDLMAGEREIYAVEVADATNVNAKPLSLHATPEMMYESYRGLKDFSVPANKPARAIQLEVGDIFSVTTDALTGAVAVGANVAPKAGQLKLDIPATAPTTRFVGEIIELGTLGFDGTASATIRVIKN